MAADTGRELDGPQVDANTNARTNAIDGVMHEHGHIQGILGITEKSHRHAVTGIENDPIRDGKMADSPHQCLIEIVLERHLLGDRYA